MGTQHGKRETGDLWLAKQSSRAEIRHAIEKAQGILSWQEILCAIAECPLGAPVEDARNAKPAPR